ncbi:MAG: AraC family transcriptional regulator [Novosphingobium sp.]
MGSFLTPPPATRRRAPTSRGDWHLAEYLSLLELDGLAWCLVELGEQSGLRISRRERLNFYAVLDGTLWLTSAIDQTIEIYPGDILLVLPGNAHCLRNHHSAKVHRLDFPDNIPGELCLPAIHLGPAGITSRLLCGDLEVHWPGGIHPGRIPGTLMLKAGTIGIDLPRLIASLQGPSASALLTHLATLTFATAFRDEPRCRAQFRWNLGDPIVRATVLIAKHPSRGWTVESLAAEVGMGRSNFAARFTAQTGLTPIEALTVERMHHAEELLRNTSLKITEISERIGYRSEGAFIRRFTAHFGDTPSRFRRSALARSPTD